MAAVASAALRQLRSTFLLPTARSFATTPSWVGTLNAGLSETDPELFDALEHEKQRQRESICLIPSEVSQAQRIVCGEP